MKRWTVSIMAVLFLIPLFSACGGGGGKNSVSGATATGGTNGGGNGGGNSGLSADAVARLKDMFWGLKADGSITRWRWNTISYSVDTDNAALESATEAAAGFWNSSVGVITLVKTPKGQGNIKVFIDMTLGSNECGGYGIGGPPDAIESGKVHIKPGCENVLFVAHEFGHVLGLHHSYCGVMYSTSSPRGPQCGGGYRLTEGPAGLFEAMRYVYSRPPGTPLI